MIRRLIILLLLSLLTPGWGQSIEIPQVCITEDSTTTVPIFIYDVLDLESIQLTIEYDESIVLAEEFIENPLGILDGGYTFTTNLTEPGIIYIAIGSNSAILFSGSGMIAQIKLHSIGNLGYSALTILDAQINSDWQIPAVDGSIEIVLDELTITGQDNSEIGANHVITLGMCDGCTDEWKFGEDEDDYPDPPSGEYTNINFYQLDWFGQEDENGNVCNQIEFSTNFRSQHSISELTSWGIRGSIGGGLSSDIPIKLSWESSIIDSSSNNFQMFIYVGEIGYDMQGQNSITISQNDLLLNENFEPNIRVMLGSCANTGSTDIYYEDQDGDGLGNALGVGVEYCTGFQPEGLVANNDDNDDEPCNGDLDCLNNCNGIAEFDECGECGGSGIPDGQCDCDGNVADCAGVCGGDAVVDECGECGGDGILDGQCDCDGNERDCAGICGGDAIKDECEVCGGDDHDGDGICDIQCPDYDCAGVCGGNAEEDECGVCGGDGSGDLGCGCFEPGPSGCDNQCNSIAAIDCAGVCGGNAVEDNCGTCDTDSSNDCSQDCAGEWGETLVLDGCGVCGGNGSSDLGCGCFEPGPSGCDNQCNSTAEIDCADVCGGYAVVDDCGVCEGANLDMDCNGECAEDTPVSCDGSDCGTAEEDICGVCEGDDIPLGECDCDGNVLDCSGDCGGDAVYDICNVCDRGEDDWDDCAGNCITELDCNGDCQPDDGCLEGFTLTEGCAYKDSHCNDACVGGNTGAVCEQDCAETWGGNFWVSDCGCVANDNSGDECDDCAEEPYGVGSEDYCGNCIVNEEDNYVCEMDCNSVWGGTHPPTFSCENGEIACNYNACDLANNEIQLPQKFNISRIYPNPFNPQATIDFEVSEPTIVQLNIYNLKGQKVEVLKNAFTLPGHYSVIWNGTNYPSGMLSKSICVAADGKISFLFMTE